MKRTPPRVLEWILARCLRDSVGRQDILGDLREEYATCRRSRVGAWGWYAMQVVTVGLPYLWGGWPLRREAGWIGDVRLALRSLARSPVYTAVALLSLILGIGVNTAAFNLVNAVLFRPLPYPAQDRLFDLGEFHPEEVCGGCGYGASLETYRYWRTNITTFAGLAASTGGEAIIDGGRERTRVPTVAVTASLFDILGAQTAIGRLLDPTDELPGSPMRPVVLGHATWRSLFGSDSGIVGRSVTLDGTVHTVVGVLSSQFGFIGRGDVFVPLTDDNGGTPTDRSLWVVGRLKDGTSANQAQRELDVLSARLAAARPDTHDGWGGVVQPLRDTLLHDLGDPLAGYMLLLAAGAVLLIACANLASITAARGIERTRDAAVRAALGASRGRVFRFAIAESLVLASIGGGVGIAIAYGVSAIIDQRFGAFLPPWIQLGIDARLLGFAVLLTGLSVVIAGVLPAHLAARVDLTLTLRAAGPSMTPGRHAAAGHRLLVGSQIAFGLMLLATALLSLRQYHRVSRLDNLGYEPRGVTAIAVQFLGNAASDPGTRTNVVEEITARVRALPGITDVAIEQERFLGTFGSSASPSIVRVGGRPDPISNAVVPRHGIAASPGYFELMRIPLLRGRTFRPDDRRGGPGVAVVDERAAGVLWPGDDPLGKTLRIDDELDSGWLTIIGVVGTTVISPLQAGRTGHPRIYTVFGQSPSAAFDVLLRTEGNVTRESLLRTVHEADANLLVTGVSTVEQRLALWISGAAIIAGVMAGLAGLALVLTAVGIYGLLSYSVSTHLREIGIRLALGGTSRAMRNLVIRRLVPIFALGTVAGLGGSWALAQLGGAAGMRLGAADPAILGVVVALIATLCAVAAARPAGRAARVDPITILRED